MAIIGAYSRHKMFEELESPLFTNKGDGANPLVYSPQEQKQRIIDRMSRGFATGAGTPTAGVTAIEMMSSGGMRKTHLTITAKSLGNGGDGVALGIGALIYTFPAGDIVLHGEAYLKGAFSSVGAYTNVLDAGVGSVIASGAVSVLGGTATFEDLIGGTATGALNAGGAVVATQTSAGSIPNRLIATAAAHTLHLNCAGTWTDIASAQPVLFTGVLQFTWKLIA